MYICFDFAYTCDNPHASMQPGKGNKTAPNKGSKQHFAMSTDENDKIITFLAFQRNINRISRWRG